MKAQSSSLSITVYDALLMQMFSVEEENRDRSLSDNNSDNDNDNTAINNKPSDNNNTESETIEMANEADLGEKKEEKGEKKEEKVGYCKSLKQLENEECIVEMKVEQTIEAAPHKAAATTTGDCRAVEAEEEEVENELSQAGGGDGEERTNKSNASGIANENSPYLQHQSDLSNCEDSPQVVAHSASVSSTSNSSSSLISYHGSNTYIELGNKCGKCQNHEIEISKKGEYKLERKPT